MQDFMPHDKLFLLVMPASGQSLWMGTTTAYDYDRWFSRECALVLRDVRGFVVRPDADDPRKVQISVGAVYIGDTSQRELHLFPASVELVGAVTLENGNEVCVGNNVLFQKYARNALVNRAAASGLTIAGPNDMPSNTVPFPRGNRP